MTGGIREYARYRGVSHTAVRKAIANQRISLGPDGTIDFGAADAAWKRNTSVPWSPQPVVVAAKLSRPTKSAKSKPQSRQADSAPVDLDLGESLSEARTRRERAEADMAELKARKAAGEVIEAVLARKSFVAMGRIYSAARESLPRQLAPKLIGLTDLAEIEKILRAELRSADSRIADEIESRHGDVLHPEGAPDGSGLDPL